MKETDLFKANPDFVFRSIAGESVLVPVGREAERFYGIASVNAAGAFLWKQLGQERSVGELKKLLAAEYELEEEQSLADVTFFLEDARKRNMVLQC